MDNSKENQTFSQGKLKDSELTILVDSIRSITSSLDLNDVLEMIMKNALKIIQSAQGGYLLLFDTEKERLIPKAAVGFDERIYDFQVKVGESITGTVFQDGIGKVCKSQEEIEREMRRNNISETNYHSLTSSTGDPGYPSSFIAVPISIAEKRIGVMTVHQWNGKVALDEHELLLLQGFSEQAAIAIQNAQYFAVAKDKIDEVTRLSMQLKERNAQLQKRYEVHKALTALSLENKGLKTIIREFNQMISRPVFFYNVLDDLFYSPDSNWTADFTTAELKKIFIANKEPKYVERNNGTLKIYYLLPIHNGNVFIGCFIVLADGEVSESDRMTLEQGSSTIAMELIKKQTATEYFYKKTYEQFREMLTYKDETQVNSFASQMGVSADSYWCIAIIEIPSYNDLQQLENDIHHLVVKIQKELHPKGKMIFGIQNSVYILSALEKPELAEVISEKLAILQEDWGKYGNSSFFGGISTVYKGLWNIGKCYDEALDTIHYLSEHTQYKVMKYENIGVNRLFLHQQPYVIEQFINEVFAPLSSKHDTTSELEKTILIYMETNRSAKEAAKKLHIHSNTLYQRIKKIEDLLQIDFNNSDDILKIHLACYLKSSILK